MVDEAAYAREQQQGKEQQQAKEQHAKEQLKKGAEAKQKSVEAANPSGVKPTPTQEENDLAALGVPLDTHEDDGSGPEPEFRIGRTKQSEAKPSGSSYSTRGAAPAPAPAPAHKPT